MIEEEFADVPGGSDFAEKLSQISSEEELMRANVLRTGLDDYELEPEDFEVLEGEIGRASCRERVSSPV